MRMTFPAENTYLKFIWIVLKSNDVQENSIIYFSKTSTLQLVKTPNFFSASRIRSASILEIVRFTVSSLVTASTTIGLFPTLLRTFPSSIVCAYPKGPLLTDRERV